eukprot:gene30890-58792_t
MQCHHGMGKVAHFDAAFKWYQELNFYEEGGGQC